MFNRWSYSLARIFRFEVVSEGVLREKILRLHRKGYPMTADV